MANEMIPVYIDMDQSWVFWPQREDSKPKWKDAGATMLISESWLRAYHEAEQVMSSFHLQLEELYRKQKGLAHSEEVVAEVPHEMIGVKEDE